MPLGSNIIGQYTDVDTNMTQTELENIFCLIQDLNWSFKINDKCLSQVCHAAAHWNTHCLLLGYYANTGSEFHKQF
jgi:hypothetical protein